MPSALQSRNVRIGRRRTSVRLEHEMWDALAEICRRMGTTTNAICTEVSDQGAPGGFTSRLRVYVMEWFRRRAA